MDHAKANVRAAGSAFPSYFIADTVPVLDAAAMAAWRLEVGGMVAKPLSLTLDDLMRLERKTQRVNHYCVEGWTAVAEFTGVLLRSLAALAQADPRAEYVDFQSFDNGYPRELGCRERDASADVDRLCKRWRAAATRLRRTGTRPLAGEARLQEHEIPDEDRVHARAERRVLDGSGVRVVRRRNHLLACRGRAPGHLIRMDAEHHRPLGRRIIRCENLGVYAPHHVDRVVVRIAAGSRGLQDIQRALHHD